MIGYEIESCTSDELLRFVRALGQHRYVASRLHLAHAFTVACADDADPVLADATAWANRAISSGAIDLDSKDERLYRRISDAELNALFAAYWGSDPRHDRARALLREKLASIDALPRDVATALPFDESVEDDVFPILIDAGWELLPLKQLDHERHRGAIQSFDDFEVARFEEETAVPFYVTLHELPVIGGVELLAAFDATANALRAPFVLWQEGNETYLDYVLRGVLRAAKIATADDSVDQRMSNA